MKIQVIRQLEVKRGQRTLVVDGNGQHYVLSTIPFASDTGVAETLVFKSDDQGGVTDWNDLGGGQLVSQEGALKLLADQLEDDAQP